MTIATISNTTIKVSLGQSSYPGAEKEWVPLFCVDYRGLNDVTKVENYPLSHTDDQLDEFG